MCSFCDKVNSLFIFHRWSELYRSLCCQVLGLIRCPVYVMGDKQGGLPSFLRNNFVGNSRQQLLIGLEHAGILTSEEIKEVVQLSQSIQASAAKLWQFIQCMILPGKPRYVELIWSAVNNVSCYSGEAGVKMQSILGLVRGWCCWLLKVSVKSRKIVVFPCPRLGVLAKCTHFLVMSIHWSW